VIFLQQEVFLYHDKTHKHLTEKEKIKLNGFELCKKSIFCWMKRAWQNFATKVEH